MIDSYLNNQKFFKPNYNEALSYIVPKYLFEAEEKLGKEVDIKDQIINSHINVAKDVTSVIGVSPVANSPFSSINTLSGFSQFFVKQNELSEISPESFEFYILNRVNKSFKDFPTKEDFKSFLDNYLLPSIRLNTFTNFFQGNELASSTQISLIDNLSWLYFLNKQGPAPNYYSTSSSISELITNKLYFGETIYLNDCLNLLSEYLFKNNLNSYYPSVFASSTGEFTSGTQQLDKLNTWVDIIYSPLYADRNDTTVLDRFNLYIENFVRVNNKVINGPFSKLLKMLSFAAYDINDNSQRLESLYDIENCDKEYLPLLAELIGWRLFGSDPQKWRLQLRNAVQVYKSAGTKKSLQTAINTFFPKNTFDLESRIEEVWESYVPYLIYYALATESDYFKTNESWTRELSLKMNVGNYSPTNIDQNIKLATDRIIYEVFTNFKQNFKIPNIENKFYFRDTESEIPPFEEYPYYANTELEHDMIDVIVDRLVCFGCNRQFASGLGEYIRENTLGTVLEPRVGGWLFFTSGYIPPTNLGKLVLNVNSKKFEYTSLWSGKSSHFKVDFNANDFNFVDSDLSQNSGNAVAYTAEVINQFSPTHAIPLVHMNISGADSTSFSACHSIVANSNKVDPCEYYTNSNYQTSALYVSGYKRNTGQGKIYTRPSLETLQSNLLKTATTITNVPRNSVRRRSYEKIMPFNGYYDRTGFNMPVPALTTGSLSSLPLGFIPSSLTFQGISDYNNLPEVYSLCNSTDSIASFYGFPVSTTFNCRGHTPISCSGTHIDRGHLPDIYAIMHKIEEKRKYYQASSVITTYLPEPLINFRSKYVYQSYANLATEYANWFPNSVNNYYNFKFGRDLHKLYQTYTKEFNRHNVSRNLQETDGPNIFSHTFGPLLYNHDFDKVNNSYIVNSFSSTDTINNSNIGSIPGTYTASATSSLWFTPYKPEFVNSSIISSIDLVSISGTPLENSFAIVRVPFSEKQRDTSNYMYERTFIKIKNLSNLPRIRINLTNNISEFSSSALSSLYVNQKNFLLPEHDYRINVKGLICSNDGLMLGGRAAGVWIHTKPEGGYVWSYSKNGEWVRHDNTLDRSELQSNFFFTKQYTEIDRMASGIPENIKKLKCIDIVTSKAYSIIPLLTLDESDFEDFEIDFNTKNKYAITDSTYHKTYGQVHRKNQDYVIEVFLIPDFQNGMDNFFLLDKVNVVDLTLNEMSKVFAIENSCPALKIPLEREELGYIFKFWNDISGKNSLIGYASRDSSETSTYMHSQGGSRLDYRLASTWLPRNLNGNMLSGVEVPV